MSSNYEDVWIPLEFKQGEMDTVTDRIIQWIKDPSSEPEIEKWYKYGEPNGLPFYK